MEQKANKISTKPAWLNKRISIADNVKMKALLSRASLNTICEEALCPNISECFCNKHASFLILGTICTRGCSFCNVSHAIPSSPDREEPKHLADAVQELGLLHVVVTSPTRDDLTDGGAQHFARCIQEIRRTSPDTRIEVLIPDFAGNISALQTVLDASPDILGHNLETVRRLYYIRRGADYDRSLALLKNAFQYRADIPTKSGIMVGLGENKDEVYEIFVDLLHAGCRFISIGQYLSPKISNYPVKDFISPESFEMYKEQALKAGFLHVESGPYVRSSYNADKYLR